jgi:prepilin-type N-terminal cleavage/methylation domain-containing protein
MKMKQKKGFTLIEIIVVMVITSFMCVAMATMLLFAYRASMRVSDQKKKSEDLINFKMKLNEQLMGASTGYFIGGNAAWPYIPGSEVRLSLWYTTTPDPNTWNDKVTEMVAFYYYDRDTGETVRCRYHFDRREEDGATQRTDGLGNVIYTVWSARYNMLGVLEPINSALYTNANHEYSEIVLKNARAFQVTNHRRNIANGVASNKGGNKDIWYTDVAPYPFASDLLVQVYVDIDNNDVIYNSKLFFMNRNNKRPYGVG